jgi:anti-anti-sigma factor
MELYRDGGTLRVSGQVDGRSTHELREALREELRVGDVVLDLGDVDAVDLTALRMIAATSKQAAQEGQHLRLRGCPPLVRRLLHLSHLRGLVEYDERVADRTA